MRAIHGFQYYVPVNIAAILYYSMFAIPLALAGWIAQRGARKLFRGFPPLFQFLIRSFILAIALAPIITCSAEEGCSILPAVLGFIGYSLYDPGRLEPGVAAAISISWIVLFLCLWLPPQRKGKSGKAKSE